MKQENKPPCDICGEPSQAYHTNVEKHLCTICANGNRLYGKKPKLTRKPKFSGIYFVKLAYWKGVYSGSPKSFRIGYKYEIGEWEIARFDGSYLEFIGTDEITHWDGTRSYVTVLGPKVKFPASR